MTPSSRYDLDSLRLDATGKRLDKNLIDSVIDTSWERTVEGASTITFTLDDSEGDLAESALLTRWAWDRGDLGENDWIARGRRIDVRLGGEKYRLVKATAQGTTVTLTLEDRDVARLRERYGARKVPRKQVTRAEFGRLLIAEVKHPKIEVHVPELHIRQPVAKSKPSKQADQERVDNGDQGIDPGAGDLTVKGEKATRQQIRNAEKVMDAVQAFPEAPQRAVVALLCAITQESVMGTAGMTEIGEAGSIGWLQARTTYVSRADALDIDYNVRRFFKEPWTGTPEGGAIEQARKGRSIDEICTSIQGNATGNVYGQWKAECLRWVEAYEGGGGRVDGERTIRKPYQFERKPKENTWDCLGRLFSEVNWRRFMRNGKVWLISENRLFQQKPAARLQVGKNGVDAIDFDLDMFSRDQLQEATVTGRAGLNAIEPGQVVVIERRGPANGRWLVASVSGKFGDDAISITLRKPMPKKPEPPAPTKTVSTGGAGEESITDVKLGDTSVSGHPELKPGISEVVNAILDRFPGLTITSTTGGVHAAGSLHYSGRAADIAGDSATMNEAAAWINKSGLWERLAEGIHNPNLSVKDKSKVDPSYWGSTTWGDHRDHIHVAV